MAFLPMVVPPVPTHDESPGAGAGLGARRVAVRNTDLRRPPHERDFGRRELPERKPDADDRRSWAVPRYVTAPTVLKYTTVVAIEMDGSA